MFLIVLNETS